MAEVVKGLIYVREPLALVAFLGIVLLAAFRTKKIPELFFGLVRDKLPWEILSVLLSRFMYRGFGAFLVLGLLAYAGQLLSSKTQPGSLTLDDLRRELSGLKNPPEEKLRAESNFATAVELVSKNDFDGAIASLQKSLAAIPTQAAQEMLAFLYRQTRKFDQANSSWEAAMKAARERGDSLAQARLDRILTPHSAVLTQTCETDLIGASTPFPPVRDRFAPP